MTTVRAYLTRAPAGRAARRAARAARVPVGRLRAAIWALRALQHVRRSLDSEGLRVDVPPAPEQGAAAGCARAVETALRLRAATCLERSLILQQWLADNGLEHTVAVGVRYADADFAAHAWLVGLDDPADELTYEVLQHRPPSPARARSAETV